MKKYHYAQNVLENHLSFMYDSHSCVWQTFDEHRLIECYCVAKGNTRQFKVYVLIENGSFDVFTSTLK